jgi:hypothetical protein
VQLVRQWNQIDRNLPAGWDEARLSLRLAERDQASRASAILGALGPGRAADTLHFTVRSRGGAPSPGLVNRLLAQLDREQMAGTLELVTVSEVEEPGPTAGSLASSWQHLLSTLPEDWSDLHAELEFRSTDHLAPAALQIAPLNPTRFGQTGILRFRCARAFGYGASTMMVARCLERLDEQGLPAELRLVHVLSDTRPVGTQGPVWRVNGRSV